MIDPVSKKLFNGAGSRGPLVLMYHSISDQRGWPWAVTYDDFCRQLDLLQACGWTTKRLCDLASAEHCGPKTVVVTFDDGYRDNYAAFEALKARGMCASWFVVTRDIGKKTGWRDEGAPELDMLSLENIQELHGSGMEVASHSRTHARLTSIDDAALREEVTQSRHELAEMLGAQVDTFAYPYGAHNQKVVDAVREAGYRAACTTCSGWALLNTDEFRIRRLTIYANDSLSSFARKLAFASNDGDVGAVMRYLGARLKGRFKR